MINSSNGFCTSVLAGFVLQAKAILWKRERIWQKYQERERVGGTGEEKGDSTPTHDLGKLRSAPTLPRPGCQAASNPLGVRPQHIKRWSRTVPGRTPTHTWPPCPSAQGSVDHEATFQSQKCPNVLNKLHGCLIIHHPLLRLKNTCS